MKKYICVKVLQLEMYGDNGESLEEAMEVDESTVWEVEQTDYNMIASNEGIRLINDKGQWIEIYTDTLNEHFEQIANNLSDLNDVQLKELEGYIEEFITLKAYIDTFIVQNNLGEDEVWEKVDKDHKEAISRQHG